MLPKRDVLLAVVWTVRRWCLAAQLYSKWVPQARSSGWKSSVDVNCGVFVAACKLEHLAL